jgi:hypothetical protein
MHAHKRRAGARCYRPTCCARACPHHAQGALLCLAAATVGLGEPSETYLRQIVPPVLASFTDQDSRVRYYSAEALYNIAKVCGRAGVRCWCRVERGCRRTWRPAGLHEVELQLPASMSRTRTTP